MTIWLMHPEHGFAGVTAYEEIEMRKNGWVDDTIRFPEKTEKPKRKYTKRVKDGNSTDNHK